jgi:hypothetical protein
MLATETDDSKRQILLDLLTEEKVKLAGAYLDEDAGA